MRVIAGKYRGKKLKEFELSTTKPTLDRVKESIFNLIQFDVFDSIVLDLFSGTGALGIEAISRGSKKTYLVDNNKTAISLIKENTKSMTEDFEIKHMDYLDFLSSTHEKFDLVLLDPPYKTDYGIKAIDKLIELNLLNEKAIIIFETSEDNNFNLNYDCFKIVKKKYGTVVVYKMEKFNEI